MNDPENDIELLIDGLNNLHDGERFVGRIVAIGEKAVPHLRKYLLEGNPSHIYQPRQRAIMALADLGAREVLIEYLSTPKCINDPDTRLGEEAVESTAARMLARWRTDEVFDFLLHIAHTRRLPGVIETLSLFQRPEPVPLYIKALMDDFSRSAAEEALKRTGIPAKPALMKALDEQYYSNDTASPSRILQRRSILRVMENLPIKVEDWPVLKKMLDDDDAEISTLAGCIAMKIPNLPQKKSIVKRLIRNIPRSNWSIEITIEDCLVRFYDIAKEEIQEQISKREKAAKNKPAYDRVLQVLCNVRKRAGDK